MADEDTNVRRRATNCVDGSPENNDKPTTCSTSSQSNSVPSSQPAFAQPWGFPGPTPTAYKTATEYNQAVQQWVWQWNMWTNMMWFYSTFPLYAMSMMPMQGQSTAMPNAPGVTPLTGAAGGVAPPLVPGVNQPQNTTRPQVAQPVNAGQEFRIPPLWKRVAAEFFDFVLLFLIKLGVTLLTVEYVGGIDIERYDIEQLFSQNIDYDTAYALTYELVAMEIINRILICIFETLCLRRGVGGMVGGTTPGKRIMGLRVVSCEDIQMLPDSKVRVIPAGDIGLWNALVRSVIKNFSLAFFFPVCFTVFFFQHNRAAYDVIASCIVVEAPQDIYLW